MAGGAKPRPVHIGCSGWNYASWRGSFYTAGLASRPRAALASGDSPDRPFHTYELTAPWTSMRFHRGRRGRRGNYSASEIAEWAHRMADWRRRVEVYAYFNNDWEAFAPRNATE